MTLSGNKRSLSPQLLGSDFWIEDALNRIRKEYGVTASVFDKGKALLKFGTNPDIDATNTEAVMDLPGSETDETYLFVGDGNLITHVVCSDSGADQDVVIEGHYFDSANGDRITFVSQTATLAGQTKVALTQPLCRVSRFIFDDTSFPSGDTYVIRDVAAPLGVPGDDTAVHLLVPNGARQSRKAATTFSYRDYCIITQMYCGIKQGSGTAAVVDFDIQRRTGNKVFRPFFEVPLRVTGSSLFVIDFKPYLIVPANSDVRITANSDSANTFVYAGWNSHIAIDMDFVDEPT